MFSKVMSLIVMRWCGSMSHYGMCTVCCAPHKCSSVGEWTVWKI